LTIIVAVAAILAPAAAAPVPGRWQSDWGENQCSLILHVGDPARDTILTIRTVPAAMEVSVNLTNVAWLHSPIRDPKLVSLALDGGTVAGGDISFLPNPPDQGGTLSLTYKGELLDRLARSHWLLVTEKDRPLARFDLPTADKAVAALRECEADALRQWNIDPALWRTLRSPPMAMKPLASYVRADDFPAKAVSGPFSGTTMVKLDVDISGRATGCTVLQTSGNAAIDATTCRIIVSRARFTPAVDSSGRAVNAPAIARMRWSAN
jgi:hypothetical protein